MISGANKEDWYSDVTAITVSTPLEVAIFILSAASSFGSSVWMQG
jgi:hypothetical protein